MFKWFSVHWILLLLWFAVGFLTALWCKICSRPGHESKLWVFRILWPDYFLLIEDGHGISYYTLLWGRGHKKEFWAWLITIATGPLKILLSFLVIVAFLCFVTWPTEFNKRVGRAD